MKTKKTNPTPKTKFFKLQNVVIIAFLALLGFTSCQKEEKNASADLKLVMLHMRTE